MPSRKGSHVKSYTRKVKTKSGTKSVSVKGTSRKMAFTKPRKK
jgi:hypothetical protein